MNNYTITCIESNKENPTSHSSLFLIQALEVGHGITLGNALRRTLLSDLTGYAISAFRINALQHEFSVLPSLREDVMEVMLNLKQIVFKALPTFSSESDLALASNQKLKAVLNVKGPRVVTASMLLLPYPYLTLLNPSQYICTIVDNSSLYLEIDIEKGKAYKLVEESQKESSLEKMETGKGRTIFTDSLYSPVKNVNYKVKLINDTKGNIKESLLLDITTNGSMSPKRALQESSKVLLELFSPLLINPSLYSLSEELINLENLN